MSHFSFLKDALLSTVAPSHVRTSISVPLVEKVEKKAFSDNWIPDNYYERKRHTQDASVSIVKKTILFDIGQCIIGMVSEVSYYVAKILVKMILTVQYCFNTLTNWAVSFIFYIGRSIFCAISSIALVLLHIAQARIYSILCVTYYTYKNRLIEPCDRYYCVRFDVDTMVSNTCSLLFVHWWMMLHSFQSTW